MTRHRTRPLLAVAVAAALALGACSADDDDEASGADTGGAGGAPTTVVAQGGDSEAGEGEEAAETGGPADGTAGGATGGPALPAVPVGQPLQAGRSVIATAEIDVEVDDVADAARRAVEAAVVAGGFLAEQDAVASQRTALLVLRVPTERYDEVLDAAGALGEVLAQRVDTADVTDQVVDLDARIASGRVSVERVRDLLAQSGDVVQLATVEGELARREAELESLLGQQRVLADQVALATIRLALSEPDAAPVEMAAEPEPRPGFGGGLDRGGDVFLGLASVASAAAGFALPFLPFLVLAGAAVVVLRRRRRVTAPPPPAPASA